jgi:hypothetical protein
VTARRAGHGTLYLRLVPPFVVVVPIFTLVVVLDLAGQDAAVGPLRPFTSTASPLRSAVQGDSSNFVAALVVTFVDLA